MIAFARLGAIHPLDLGQLRREQADDLAMRGFAQLGGRVHCLDRIDQPVESRS
ncbi:hypothetical protein GGR44_001633 [Sphingobium fontiphilum]|uniref:Uncharacterized protein n=1 Tax=Sphingobium fontiphilum TaxID=944425 RepID=A0A7W6DN08_9SPHN|nr:hypothetical protein [Sphingobium fontiphilum]